MHLYHSHINNTIKIKNELKEYKQRKDYLQKCIEISVDIVGQFDKNGNLLQRREDIGFDNIYDFDLDIDTNIWYVIPTHDYV